MVRITVLILLLLLFLVFFLNSCVGHYFNVLNTNLDHLLRPPSRRHPLLVPTLVYFEPFDFALIVEKAEMGTGEAGVSGFSARAFTTDTFFIASIYTYFLDYKSLNLPGFFRLGGRRLLLDGPIVL